jgi:tetratricopeptide (TPR) repeat protein
MKYYTFIVLTSVFAGWISICSAASIQKIETLNSLEWHSPAEMEIVNKIAALESDPKKILELSEAYTEYGLFLGNENKDFINSKKYLIKARQLAKKNSFEYAKNTFCLACLAALQRNYNEAEQHLFDCHEIYNAFTKENLQLLLSDTSLYKKWEPISAKLCLDVIYSVYLSPIQAEEHLQERIKEFKENHLQNSLILSYELLSRHYVRQKDLKGAINCYESLSKLTDNFNFSDLANLYEQNSEWKKAILWYNKALESDLDNKAFIYEGLGLCKMRLHYFDEAKNDYLEAQKIYKEEGNVSEEANTINGISYLHFFKGEADLSIKYGLEALKILKESKDNSFALTRYAALYDTLACAYELNGQLDLAEEYFMKVIAIEKSLGDDSNNLAKRFISLGNVHLKQNKVEEARKCWNESLQYLSETGDSDLIIKVKRNLHKNPVEIPRIQQYRP